MSDGEFVFRGKGSNVVGSFGSGSMVLDMPSAYSFGTYDLDYAGSFIDCGDRPEFEFADGIGFILAGWVKLAKFNDHQFIAGKSNWAGTSHSEYFLGLNNDSKFHWVCNNGTNGGTCQSDNSFQSEVEKEGWTHVMGVRDTSNNLTLYINGVAQADTETCTGNVGVSSQDFGIGTRNNGGTPDFGGDYFRGNIRDVRLYSGSATATELQDIFADTNCGGVTLQAGSIEGWWQLDGNLNDSSGNGFTGVLTTGSDSTDYWDGSIYNLNQIGAGSVSGSVTVSGGTFNLRDSTSISFDGGTSHIDLSSSFTMSHTGSSLSFWVKRDNATGNIDTILGEDGDANQHWVQIKTNGEVVMRDYPKDLSTSSAITNTSWNHVVITLDGDENGAIYFNGVSQPIALNQIVGDPVFDLIGMRSTVDELDGELKDIKVYDTALTPTQVELLFKNQWIGSPVHWWKMTEGAGSTIADSGATGGKTGTLDSTAWVNPTYDLDGRLTIAASGTVSAPKGDFDIDENFQNYGTFTHNSGTVVFTVGDNSYINTEGTVDPVFYNVTNEANQLRFYNDVTIERQLQLDAGASHCYIWANKTLTMGSTASPETGYPKLINNMNTGDKQFWFYAGDGQTATLQGVSKLYPIIFTKAQATADIEWGYHDGAAAQIKNVDFQCDIETDTSDTLDRIKLTGDCEFDKLTISNGDKIDLNGQRVKFGDDFTVNSGGHNNGAGLIFAEGDFTDGNGTGNSYTTKTLVMDGGYCNPAQTTWQQMFLRNGTHTIGGNRDWGGTPIIMAGTSNFTSNNTWGNITIPTAGILDGNNKVVTTEGDFNMAGGIIGKSALDFNASSNPYVDLDNNAAWAFGTNNFTLEGWFRSDTDTGLNRTIIANGDAGDNGFLLYMQGGGNVAFFVNNIKVCNAVGPYENDSKWHHVAAVRDGNDYLLYIDGKLMDQSTQAAQNLTHSGKASIGARDLSNSVDAFFDGQIGMVRVFKGSTGGARTESEIRADMFHNYADMVDKTDLFAMYQFDEATGAEVVNIQGNTNYDGTITNATWVAPGTYTYDTSTLKFDKAGTCNFTGHQDATATQLHSIHITSGTTVAANCRDNDLVMNSGSVMINSGTLTSNRNWQYKSRNMPIVGPNSDLKVSTNIWYYMSDGSGLPASGAGTDYYQLRPATNVYMQGNFDCQNGLLQSGGDLHLNGYACSTSKIWNYGGGNLHADPGSSIVFDNADGFNVSYGENPTTMFFVASGEACAMFNQFVDLNNSTNYNYIDTNAAIVPDDAAFTVSFWYKSPTNIADYSDTLTTAIGFNGDSEGGISLINSNWLILCQGSVYRYFNSAPNADGLWHHMLAYVDPTNASNIKMWIDGSEQTPNSTATGGTTSWGGDVHFGFANYGAMPVSLSDIRFYNAANTPTGSVATLAAINPATNVSGAYADPSNALSAYGWFKLNGTDKGLVSIADTIGTYNSAAFATAGSPANGVKSGFVTISSSATPYNPINNLFPAGVTLTNVYMSGSKDIVVGQRKENSAGFMPVASQLIKTQGTVVLE